MCAVLNVMNLQLGPLKIRGRRKLRKDTGVSMSDVGYVCSLSAESLRKAQEELNEDPQNRMGAIHTLRQWLLQQEHIKFPKETRVLLMFLRHAKFSQLKARETIEKFCEAKSLHQEIFSNLNPSDDMFIRFIKTGTWLVLPGRSEDGVIRLINRAGAYNPSEWKTHKAAWFKSVYLFWQYISLDEENQVNGYRFIADFSQFTMAHQMFFTMDEMKGLLKRFQNAFPLRYKGVHHYNGGPILDAMFHVMYPFMDKKFRERVVMEGKHLEKIYQIFPMQCLPEEYLPDEYTGPNAGTIDEITDRMLAEMQQAGVLKQLSLISDEQWGFDAALKPKTQETENASFRMLKW